MSAHNEYLTVAPSRHSARPRALTLVADVAKKVFWDWPERARQRRQLARLDDRMLGDIGISRGDVESEFRKARWQR